MKTQKEGRGTYPQVMAAPGVLSSSERGALDQVLRPHLRLEPVPDEEEEEEGRQSAHLGVRLDQSLGASSTSAGFQRGKDGRQPFSRPTVHQSTVEADNKRRPGVLRRNSSRFTSPSPEPPDPNSEAKSQTIRRMQSNLEEWDKQLEQICQKKSQNDSITQSELENRDAHIKELTQKYSSECEKRQQTETKRDQLTEDLKSTKEELEDSKHQVDQLQRSLSQYELAYRELDESKKELETELEAVNEQLEQSEGMRRRLNDQVTELQGQLAIEEQRSRFCTIL